jgi:RecA/RadA recombinase
MKKFSRKSAKETEEVVESPVLDDSFFDEFIKQAKAQKVDLIVPEDADDPVLQVKYWIKMPQAIADFIGAPGIPCGLITEIFGPPDSGKSTLCTEIIKQAQLQGGTGILCLSEMKVSLPRMEACGVNVTKMPVRLPKTIEEVQEVVHDIVAIVKKVNRPDKPVVIVWDSLAATPCAKELDEKRGDFAADQAAAITVLLRKAQGLLRDNNIAFVIINQISTKIGVTFGKKTQAKGGLAPKFYSALRIEFAQIGRVRATGASKDDDFCGIKTVAEVVKSHISTPFSTKEFIVDHKGFVFDRPIEKGNKYKTFEEESEGGKDGSKSVSRRKKDGEHEED